MKEILISSKKELDIYMDPQRQRLLKCMELQGQAQTARQLSLLLGISPSSVSFHLKKLESLGLVELERTEMIHGICARYYRPVPALVQLRANDAGPLKDDKELLLEYLLQDSWAGYKEYIKSADDRPFHAAPFHRSPFPHRSAGRAAQRHLCRPLRAQLLLPAVALIHGCP